MEANSVGGGMRHTQSLAGHKLPSLSHHEQQIARDALAKLNLEDGRHSAGLAAHGEFAANSGFHTSHVVGSGHGQLLAGTGHDTFLGGAGKGHSLHAGTDRLLAGSGGAHAQSHTARALADTSSLRHGFHLSGEHISVVGATAASFKAETLHGVKAATTITLGDKTTVTVSGVSLHDLTKGHVGSK